MKILTKIVAVLAMIIGLLAAVTGSRVLLGVFDPGYQYFTALISYNIAAGLVSIYTGFLIWKEKDSAVLFSLAVFAAHFLVLILLKTVYSDIISDHSVGAMTFRSVAWFFFSAFVWFTIRKK